MHKMRAFIKNILFFIVLALILCLGASFSTYAVDQKHTPIHALSSSLSLGDVQFSHLSTDSSEAEEHFLLGITFLEAFSYDLAAAQFQQAQTLDPGFAMGYWGEVMATKHPIWHFEDLPAARVVLARYEKNKDGRTLSEEEQGYLKAAKAMIENPTLEARDMAYLEQMKILSKQFPDDPNIASFYMLAILGLVADFPENEWGQKQLELGKQQIDQRIKQFPHHPGVVHYYLHYHDAPDPAYAAQALPSAKTALTLMASSSHVTHMATHIYRRLGYWDDYIVANQISIKASDKLCKLFKSKPLYQCDAENKYHSTEWLQEGYLQKKRYQDADKLVKKMAVLAKKDSGLLYQEWYYKMWARQVLSSQDWKMKQITIKPIAQPGDNLYLAAYAECGALLASGFLAIHQRQPIDKTIKRMEHLVKATNHLPDQYVRQTCEISLFEVRAEYERVNNNLLKATDFGYQARTLAREQISTELTPSIPFLSAEQYCQQHFN